MKRSRPITRYFPSKKIRGHMSYAQIGRLANAGARFAANKIGNWYKKYKNSKRNVKTHFRPKGPEGKALQEWDGVFKSNVTIPGRQYPKFLKLYKTTYGKNSICSNSASQYSTVIGAQQTQDIGTFNRRSDINNIFDATNERGVWRGFVNNQLWRNQSNAQIFLDVYFCVCNRDTDLSPLAVWADLITQYATAGTAGFYNSSPKDFKEFKKWWRIVKIQKVCLSPGNVWQLQWKHFPNKWIPTQYVQNTYNTDYLKNVTASAFAIYYGPPLNDEQSTTEVTLGFIQRLDVVSSLKYYYNNIPIFVTSQSFTNTLPTSHDNNAEVMLEDADEKADAANA